MTVERNSIPSSSLGNNSNTTQLSKGLTKELANSSTKILCKVPSAQKEIVKCKDCKFANSLKIGIVCRNMSHSVTENDFCSRAERRTDE